MTKIKSQLHAYSFASLLLFSFTCAASSDYSDLADDEVIQFFRSSAWLNDDGDVWMVPIHGWLYEPSDSRVRKAGFAKVLEETYGLTTSPDNKELFSRRINLLLADNERGKRVVIEIAGRRYQLDESAANGHFQSTLAIPVEQLTKVADSSIDSSINSSIDSSINGLISYRAILQPTDQREFIGETLLIPSQGKSVVSDIDDTVKLSNVTDRKKLLESTFFKKFTAVDGMSERYRQWGSQGASLHFVSSSPWQLYAPLDDFLVANEFPTADLSLKSIRFRDTSILDLFKKGTETKPAAIELILKRYPNRQFTLVGDSGEQDAEVYASMAEKYPEQIELILIRNVSGASDIKMQRIFSKIPANKWQVFRSINEVDQ